MRRIYKRMILPVLILLFGVLLLWWQPWKKEEIILHLGIFAGSYWDVPVGNCYEIIDDTIARFEAEHPGVTVKYTSGVRKDAYSEWLSEQILLGSAPDVFMILPDDFNLYSSLGVMKTLDGFYKIDKDFNQEYYYPAALEYGKVLGKQYALPYESVPTLMFVNKTLLNQENIAIPENDWTWDDFYEICEAVTKDKSGNGVMDQFGVYAYTWEQAVYSNGASLFDQMGTTSYFGNEKVEEAVRFVKRLNELNAGYQVTSKEFDMGQVAFRPFSFSDYRTYKPYPWSIKKYSNFEWDCIKLPAGPAGDNVSTLDTLLMGINDRTKEEQLAWELLKMFCYDEQTQMNLFTLSQGVSVRSDVTATQEVLDVLKQDTPGSSTLDMTFLNQVMESAVVTPKFRKYESAMQMADNEMKQIATGEKALDNTLLILQREINNYLQN